MTQDDIIRMAREAGIIEFRDAEDDPRVAQMAELLEFYALATAKEREARQAAQIENEELKARLARAGLEQHRAVLAAIRARKDNT